MKKVFTCLVTVLLSLFLVIPTFADGFDVSVFDNEDYACSVEDGQVDYIESTGDMTFLMLVEDETALGMPSIMTLDEYYVPTISFPVIEGIYKDITAIVFVTDNNTYYFSGSIINETETDASLLIPLFDEKTLPLLKDIGDIDDPSSVLLVTEDDSYVGLVGISDKEPLEKLYDDFIAAGGLEQDDESALSFLAQMFEFDVITTAEFMGEEPAETDAGVTDDKYGIDVSYYDIGQYKVGTDIPAGEYIVLSVNSLGGYFSVSKDANNDEIIFNDMFDTNSIVTVYDGEYLELSRAIAIPADEFYSKHTINYDNKTGIMMIVGKDIPAGEYHLTVTGDLAGYYCIYDSSRHDNIITNDMFDNTTYVSVSDGQYLELSRCVID